jgi:hypothetical protein
MVITASVMSFWAGLIVRVWSSVEKVLSNRNYFLFRQFCNIIDRFIELDRVVVRNNKENYRSINLLPVNNLLRRENEIGPKKTRLDCFTI